MALLVGAMASVIILAGKLISIWHFHRYLYESLALRASQSASIQAKSLSVPLWNLDTPLVESILAAFKDDPDFIAAAVLDDKDQVLTEVGTPNIEPNNVVVEKDVLVPIRA